MGKHCERCLAQIKPDFYKRACRRFHGVEYLCQECRTYIDSIAGGPKLLNYMEENDGCLFEELRFAEERLGVKFEAPN